MYNLGDLEFLMALVSAKTFTSMLFEVACMLLIAGVTSFVAYKSFVKVFPPALNADVPKFGWKWFSRINSDDRGTASAVDFVLVVPLFMFMICLFVQMAMIVNASLIVHYSAFSAARSARVHYCNRSVLEYPLGFVSCNINKARREAEKAAKFVLIAASPVDSSVSASGTPPQQVLDWLSSQYLKRDSALVTQARYAFDSRNVDVRVRAARSSNPIIQKQYIEERLPPTTDLNKLTDQKLRNSWPVTVRVEFVKHLGVPLIGPFLSDTRRGNDHFQIIEAEVTLL